MTTENVSREKEKKTFFDQHKQLFTHPAQMLSCFLLMEMDNPKSEWKLYLGSN